MAKMYMEPEAIVRFDYTSNTFSRKTYEDILIENREVIRKLTEYSGRSLYYISNDKKINEDLKCYITSGGNYKLYGDIYYSHKHKEEEARRPQNDDQDAKKDYSSWVERVYKEQYKNNHIEEFDVKIEHYGSCENKQLTAPIKIEL